MRVKPWKSPVSLLPRPAQCPITQVVFAEWTGQEAIAPDMRFDDAGLRWYRMIVSAAEGGYPPVYTLVSLPLSDFLLSPVDGVRELPMVLTRLARPMTMGGTSFHAPQAALDVARCFSIKVSPDSLNSRSDFERAQKDMSMYTRTT